MTDLAETVATETQAPALVEIERELRRAAKARARILEREASRDDYTAELRSEIQMAEHACALDTEADRKLMALHLANAELWFRQWLAERPGHDKHVTSALARIEARKPAPEATQPKDGTEEATQLWAWAEARGLIREQTKRVLDWSAIRALALHGEEVPGVTVTDDAEDKVTVKWNERRREETEG